MDVVRELADRIIVLHQRHPGGRWRAGRGDCIARGARGLFGRSRPKEKGAHERDLLQALAACTPTSGRTTSCTAWTWTVRGQLTMLLGRNGAGKTTTLRTIMGLWRASQGTVVFDGQDITRWPRRTLRAGHRLRAGEHGHLCRPDRQGEHAAGGAPARTPARWTPTRLQWIGAVSGGEKFWNHPAGKLSGGQKQMLAVAAPSSSRASC